MSKFKKMLSLLLVVAVTAGITITGTLAYLTSEDSDVNVMTLGKVKIEQHEYQRVVNDDGTYKVADDQSGYVLEAFEQGKALLPATDPMNFGAGSWDSTTVKMTQVNSYGGMQVFANPNAQDKFVTVENTGKTDAYVRTLVALELGDVAEDDFNNVIGISSRSTADVNNFNQPWLKSEVGAIEIDGNNYVLVEFVYHGAALSDGSFRHEDGILPAGDTSYPSLCQVYMKDAATNEDVEKIDGNKNGTYDILVISQAVQADGFADAKTALDTAFGKSSEKAAEWFGGKGKVQYVEAGEQKAQVMGEEAAEMLDSLAAGNNLIVDEDMDLLGFDTNNVDAQGATVTLNGVGPEAYGYLAFLPDAGEDVTVSNLNVTGSGFVEVGHRGMGGGQYVLNNVTIQDLAATLANGDKGFTLGCAFMGMGDVTLNNCTMTGATAVQDGVMPVDLGCGQAWSGYNDGNDNKISTTINGGEYGTIYCWSQSVVIVNGAEVDTMYVSPINGTVTIKTGTHVETLNVDYGTSTANATRLAKLVIEEGATVDAIVYNGTTYTVAEWNAYVASL